MPPPWSASGDGTDLAAGGECDRRELLGGPPPFPEPLVTLDLCMLRLNSGTALLKDGDDGFVLGVWYP